MKKVKARLFFFVFKFITGFIGILYKKTVRSLI